MAAPVRDASGSATRRLRYPFTPRDIGPLYGERWRVAPDDGKDEVSCSWTYTIASPHTLTPTPALRPGPHSQRGRSKARAPVARNPCLLAPAGEGLAAAGERRTAVLPSPAGTLPSFMEGKVLCRGRCAAENCQWPRR
ncbi:hypothetical protein XcodCFBP4690_10655 [Xanthomonas codiaei]|uniref:Uncharacterized protein n=1 Tax=Xanthomonas codiaei TaxID=56463 RepID=A0A2S7CR79_9XANT|nr:hypothetical protein XcodCFBP4690_10655 [Xanthomonas codiaei]